MIFKPKMCDPVCCLRNARGPFLFAGGSTFFVAAGRLAPVSPLRQPPGSGTAARRVLIEVLRVLPRAALSRFVGRLAGLRLPGRLQRREIEIFAHAVGIDLDQVGQPLHSFSTLQEFFARPLPKGTRPIDPAPDSLVAPCDGAWGEAGRIENGLLCQIKGRTYTVASLIGDAERAAVLEGGWYATFYLAPHNYHRFHTPCAMGIAAAEHIPGTLWPVNRAGLEGVENLFARNERIVAYGRPEVRPGGGDICMVAVGAVMVGKVRVTFDDLTTNVAVDPKVRRLRSYEPPVGMAKGGEWGRFEFGSTIVLLIPADSAGLEVEAVGTEIRLGERIGTFLQG